MKRSSVAAPASAGRWTFVARQTTGRVAMRKIAVSELDRTRRIRGKNGTATRLDSPELAQHLTRAFQLAVRRVKRTKGRDGARA